MKNCPETVQIQVAEVNPILSILEQNVHQKNLKSNKIPEFIDFIYSVDHNELLEISQFSKFITSYFASVPDQSYGHRGAKLQIL